MTRLFTHYCFVHALFCRLQYCHIKLLIQPGLDRNNVRAFCIVLESPPLLSLYSCDKDFSEGLHGFSHFCSKFSSHALLLSLVWVQKSPPLLWICLELRLGAVALTSCSLAYHHLPLQKTEDYFGWTGHLGRKPHL